MKKDDCLAGWKTLPDNAPILKNMRPIAYKSKGSSYMDVWESIYLILADERDGCLSKLGAKT